MNPTAGQREYIIDLAVEKLKTFAELKRLIIDSGIVSKEAKTVANADSLAAILDAIDMNQASKLIDELKGINPPKRDDFTVRQIGKMTDQLDKIMHVVDNWDFETLG